MKGKVSTIRLKQMNRAYWNAASRAIPEYKRIQLIKSRKKYFSLLRKRIPFLRKILDPTKQRKINIKVNSKNYSFTLLGTAFSMKRNSRPVVVLLDSLGKKYLFYRSTGINSKTPGRWFPFNSLKIVKRKDGSSYLWYEKFEGHPNFPELFVKLGENIKKLEPKIHFMEVSASYFVNAINNYL
jgi:hypothetical protein